MGGLLLEEPSGTGSQKEHALGHLHMAQRAQNMALVPAVGRGMMTVGAAELLGLDLEGVAAHPIGKRTRPRALAHGTARTEYGPRPSRRPRDDDRRGGRVAWPRSRSRRRSSRLGPQPPPQERHEESRN